MQPQRWRKRPVVVEAAQLTTSKGTAIRDWIRSENVAAWLVRPAQTTYLLIETPEGTMRADVGDWIVREPFPTDTRRFYPVKDAIFRRCFDQVVLEITDMEVKTS